jgi:1-acyl-sn-glycerol-3-phosphate acyltransferase
VFVAKEELRRQAVAGSYLRRLGTLFVERLAADRAMAEAAAMAEAVEGGASIIVFPEGTFAGESGLLPFHLGAFLAAARAGAPVVPVTIRGSRDALPDGRWWLRHAPLQVDVCEAIEPTAGMEPFASAVQLREKARSAIAARLAPGN